MLEHTCSQRAVAGSSSVSMKQGADVQHETHVQRKMQRAGIIISCGQVLNMHKDIYNNSENQHCTRIKGEMSCQQCGSNWMLCERRKVDFTFLTESQLGAELGLLLQSLQVIPG